MIKYKDIILENYSIDPITAIITNSKGEIQKTHILNGRPYFKGMLIHEIQVHTKYGYKKGFDVHHIDENKMNNSIENLMYLTHSEHAKIHGKKLSEETRRKMRESHKGENHHMFGKHHTEETRRKMRESHKGKNTWTKNLIWINNGIENRFIPLDDDIPEGFSRGRLKKIREAEKDEKELISIIEEECENIIKENKIGGK